MFLEDELEYARLKRNDNIMGWLAIVFVAALVFMFAGIMNSASATGSQPSLHDHPPVLSPVVSIESAKAQPAQAFETMSLLTFPGQRNDTASAAIVIAQQDTPDASTAAGDTLQILSSSDSVSQTMSDAKDGDITADHTPLMNLWQSLTSVLPQPSSTANVQREDIIADHDIVEGLILMTCALMGGSFILLAFGGPRGTQKDEDMIDVL